MSDSTDSDSLPPPDSDESNGDIAVTVFEGMADEDFEAHLDDPPEDGHWGMVRMGLAPEHLDALPDVVVPDFYEVWRWQGDPFVSATKWVALVTLAFGSLVADLTPERFLDDYVNSSQFDPEGLFFITHRGETAGTALAWVDVPFAEPEDEEGRLQWLAVHPSHRRRGVGRALALLVLHHHRARRRRRVYAVTESFRAPALRLLRSLGFAIDSSAGEYDGYAVAGDDEDWEPRPMTTLEGRLVVADDLRPRTVL